MKKILIWVFIGIFVVGLIYMIVVNTVLNKNEEIIKEYIPEIEMSDEELRKTIVTLYFINEKDGKIQAESRLIDAKELLRDPYITLVGMLIEGPKGENLEAAIPQGTKVIDAKKSKSCVTLNLSKEFVENAERRC